MMYSASNFFQQEIKTPVIIGNIPSSIWAAIFAQAPASALIRCRRVSKSFSSMPHKQASHVLSILSRISNIDVAEILGSEEFSAALSVLCFGSNKRMFNTLYKYIFKILSLWLNFFKLLLFFLLTDFLWEDFVRLFTMARYFGQHDMTEDSRQGFELSPSESTPFEGEFVYSGRYMRGCSRSEYCSCADILSYGVRAFVCVIALFAWLWPCEVFLCINRIMRVA